MRLLSATILLTTLISYSVCGNDGVAPEPVSSTTTSSTTVSSTTVSSTTSSTTPATTTKVTSATTPTTSTAPTTSSTTTPTTPTTTSTTVAPPTSTSTARPTETPTTAVPPSPEPKPGTWQVANSTNSSCILLKMVAELVVHFNTSSNTSQVSPVLVPTNATVDGSCGNGNATVDNQTMTLQWSYVKDMNNTMKFVFTKKDKKFELDLIHISVVLDSIHFKNASDQRLNFTHKQADFVTPVEMSYKCDKEQTLNFYNDKNVTNATTVSLKISQFQFQAFGNITKQHFADAKDCEPYETPDIVPIAVGCALMALIIIVLVGYLIGRRRNQARGYLSM